MATARKISVLLSVMLLASACSTPHPRDKTASDMPGQVISGTSARQYPATTTRHDATSLAQQELNRGVASFEDNDLNSSRSALTHALQSGLIRRQDQVTAHKYLAFIDCSTHLTKRCRIEFKEALEIDPSFTLAPAEAGHPVWGPIFITEKARYANTLFARSKRQ